MCTAGRCYWRRSPRRYDLTYLRRECYWLTLLPEAGGFDAIWLLVCDPVDCSPDQRPTERIEYVWSHYESVSPLMAVESKAKGSRTENIDDIMGLKDTLHLS